MAMPKLHKCKYKKCGQLFEKRTSTQKTCYNLQCAIGLVEQEKSEKAAKEERKQAKETRKRKIDTRTRPEWVKVAQAAFNAFIRERDKVNPGKCICCDKPLSSPGIGGGFDCGHYRSIGSAPHLRFDERNAHGQTKQCNRWRSGRAVDYRIGLIKRIGLEAVEALEADQTTRKWTVEDLKEITTHYKQRLKELQLKNS